MCDHFALLFHPAVVWRRHDLGLCTALGFGALGDECTCKCTYNHTAILQLSDEHMGRRVGGSSAFSVCLAHPAFICFLRVSDVNQLSFCDVDSANKMQGILGSVQCRFLDSAKLAQGSGLSAKRLRRIENSDKLTTQPHLTRFTTAPHHTEWNYVQVDIMKFLERAEALAARTSPTVGDYFHHLEEHAVIEMDFVRSALTDSSLLTLLLPDRRFWLYFQTWLCCHSSMTRRKLGENRLLHPLPIVLHLVLAVIGYTVYVQRVCSHCQARLAWKDEHKLRRYRVHGQFGVQIWNDDHSIWLPDPVWLGKELRRYLGIADSS